MEMKKTLAVLAVALMALSGIACIVDIQPESSAAALEDQGMVLFAYSNSSWDEAQYDKLGEGASWDGSSNTLTLTNVDYRTVESAALKIVSDSAISFNIVLEGTNSFACGYNGDIGTNVASACIYSDANVTLTISGADGAYVTDGSLTVVSDLNGLDPVTSSYGICSIAALTIDNCMVAATSGNVTKSVGDDGSYGIYSSKSLSVLNGAVVYGKSGNVIQPINTSYKSSSAGVAVANLTDGFIAVTGTENMESYLYGESGSVTAPGGAIATMGVYCNKNISVSYGILHGYGGNAIDSRKSGEGVSGDLAESIGVWCGGNMTVDEYPSEITGVGGNAYIYDGDVCSAGICFMVDVANVTFNVTNAAVHCTGGEVKYEKDSDAFVHASFGMFFRVESYDFTANISGSILDLKTAEKNYGEYPVALAAMDAFDPLGATKGTLNITDTEISATTTGGGSVIWAKTITISDASPTDTPRKILVDGNVIAASARDTAFKNATGNITQIYTHVVNIRPYVGDKSPVLSLRVSEDTFEFPECDYLPPIEGMHFVHWRVNLQDYNPGEVYEFANDYESINVNAIWNYDNPDNSQPIMVAIVFAVGLACCAMAVVLYGFAKH